MKRITQECIECGICQNTNPSGKSQTVDEILYIITGCEDRIKAEPIKHATRQARRNMAIRHYQNR